MQENIMGIQTETDFQNGFTLNVASTSWPTLSEKLNARISHLHATSAACCRSWSAFKAEHIPGQEDDQYRFFPGICSAGNCTKQMCIDKRTMGHFIGLGKSFLPVLALKGRTTLNHIVFTTGKHKANVTASDIKSWSRCIRQTMRRFPTVSYTCIVECKRQRDDLYHLHFHLAVLSWNCPNVNDIKAAWNEVCSKKHKAEHLKANEHFAVHAERANTLKLWSYFAKRLGEWGLARDHATDEIYYAASHEEYVKTSFGVRKVWSHGINKEQAKNDYKEMLKLYTEMYSTCHDVETMVDTLKEVVYFKDNPGPITTSGYTTTLKFVKNERTREFLNNSEQLNIFRLLAWLVAPPEWRLTFLGYLPNKKPDGLPPDDQEIDRMVQFAQQRDRELFGEPLSPDPDNQRGPGAVLTAIKAGVSDISAIQKSVVLAGLTPIDILQALEYNKTRGLIMETSPGRYCSV